MPHRLSLTEMAAAICGKRLSPVELAQAHLDQIARVNPSLNAFTMVLAEQALNAARRSETRVQKGETLGALEGLPLTIKDSFDIEGLPSRCGSHFRDNTPAKKHSTVAKLMIDAGAVILGKTNTPELLRSYETDNALTGCTRNPWNPERTPGGSSGGESAAIASRCSAAGAGSDGGGSIRIPAHFCGIVGLKPTHGRVPMTGHHPYPGHLAGWMTAAGPMARSVRDARELFRVLAGYDPHDPFSTPGDLPPTGSELRIGVMEQFLDVPVQPAMREAVRRAANLLDTAGIAIGEFRPTGLEAAPNVWAFFFGALGVAELTELTAGRESEMHWTLREVLEKAPPAPTYESLQSMIAERDRLREVALNHMERFPILLLPVCGVAAFHHRERRWQLPEKSLGLFQAAMPATTFNLLGFPALSVPMGFDADGLPVGVQLAARPFEDELLLEVGMQLEEARGPLPSPPDY